MIAQGTTGRLRPLALALFLLLGGCASLMPLRASLDDSVRDYQRLLRWNESTGAAAYVAGPLQTEYLQRIKPMEKVRIVEYDIKRVVLKEETKKAEVTVEFKYYMLDSATVKSVVDTQKWEYEPDAKPSGWRLTSFPPEFR